MKICILFIYSDTEYYNKMLEIQQKYVHKYNNVDTFFIKMDNTQNDEIIINDDIISVKGEELYLNILYKTIKSFELLVTNNYDYFIRSNISTIIDIEKLLCYLENVPKTNLYGSASTVCLRWLDDIGGIFDYTYYGLNFAVGFCIILSNDLVNNIIINKDKINFSIVDDVSISIYLHQNVPECICNLINYNLSCIYTNPNNNDEENGNYIIYRNRSENRYADIIKMDKILNLIYN